MSYRLSNKLYLQTQALKRGAKRYAERKRQTREILERCAAVNVGYEPMVFESTGSMEEGGQFLLRGICKLCDELIYRKSGERRLYDTDDVRSTGGITSCYPWIASCARGLHLGSEGYPNIFGFLHNLNHWPGLLLKCV